MKCCTWLLGLCLTLPAWAEVKVVYHLNEGVAQASRAVGNIRNHLSADPTAKIVVVAHGQGIDFLLDGALNAQGQPFAGSIAALANQGVRFEACQNTLMTRNIAKEKLVLEASVVPSGVAQVARLQAEQSFVYLRP